MPVLGGRNIPRLRRAVRGRGHFSNYEAAMKLLSFVLNHLAQDWKRPPREWTEAKTQFAILFGERFTCQVGHLHNPDHRDDTDDRRFQSRPQLSPQLFAKTDKS